MADPKIIMEDFQGRHNLDLAASRDRIIKGNTYKDASTICIIPTRGVIPARVVQSWMGLITPMNNRFCRIFMTGMEVGEAYNNAIEVVLNNPELSTWKYILTLEEDNMPPADGLLKLIEDMEKYDVIGGLYWTKGEGGQPMIYGNPLIMPRNYIPQIPIPDTLQECNGLGMGFNLYKIEIFKKMPKPWFKTIQSCDPGVGPKICTQDLYFYDNAARYGYRFACDTRVKVGHYDLQNDIVW